MQPTSEHLSKLSDQELIDAASANEHSKIRTTMQWPLNLWSTEDTLVTTFECDYCGVRLCDDDTAIINLDIIYRAVSQHRLDGCPEAPT